jgi:hypothetical protein
MFILLFGVSAKSKKNKKALRLCGKNYIKKGRENFHGLFLIQKKGPWVRLPHGPLKMLNAMYRRITSLEQTRCNGFATTTSYLNRFSKCYMGSSSFCL